VTPDADGHVDYIWITTLIQCLKLSPGESPFYANHGIPAQQSVVQQVFPDYYVAQTQSQFAQYFAALIVTKVPGPEPVYQVNVTTQQGVRMQLNVLDGQKYNEYAVTETGQPGISDDGQSIIVG
jgi:hypothetical protein